MKISMKELSAMTEDERNAALDALVNEALKPAEHHCPKCGKPWAPGYPCLFCRTD